MAIMTTSGSVLIKAGENVSSDLTGAGSRGETADTIIGRFISGAQSLINTTTGTNYNDSYSGLNEDVKWILEDTASSLAAVSAINYDMSGYTSRTEAQTMLNVNWAIANKNLQLLKGEVNTDFINTA